jgi:hypothetical protein
MSQKTQGQPQTTHLDTASDFLVGGGIVTMALFPLAIPMVALVIAAALPVLALGVAAALVAAAIASPILILRALSRRLTPMRRGPGEADCLASST